MICSRVLPEQWLVSPSFFTLLSLASFFLLHIVVNLQLELLCLISCDSPEAVGLRIAAHGEGYALSQQMAGLCRGEPMGLRRFPVDKIKIGILRAWSRRRTLRLLAPEIAHDHGSSVLVDRQPQAFASAIAVGIHFAWRIQSPEINKW